MSLAEELLADLEEAENEADDYMEDAEDQPLEDIENMLEGEEEEELKPGFSGWYSKPIPPIFVENPPYFLDPVSYLAPQGPAHRSLSMESRNPTTTKPLFQYIPTPCKEEHCNDVLSENILPTELWMKILAQVNDYPHRFRLACVCHHWKQIVYNEPDIGIVDVRKYLIADRTRCFSDQMKHLVKMNTKIGGFSFNGVMNDIRRDTSQLFDAVCAIVGANPSNFKVFEFSTKVETGRLHHSHRIDDMLNDILHRALHLKQLSIVFARSIFKRMPVSLCSQSSLESAHIWGFMPRQWTLPASITSLTFQCSATNDSCPHARIGQVAVPNLCFSEAINLRSLKLYCGAIIASEINFSSLEHFEIGPDSMNLGNVHGAWSTWQNADLINLTTLSLALGPRDIRPFLRRLAVGCDRLTNVNLYVGCEINDLIGNANNDDDYEPMDLPLLIRGCTVLKSLVVNGLECTSLEVVCAIMALFESGHAAMELIQITISWLLYNPRYSERACHASIGVHAFGSELGALRCNSITTDLFEQLLECLGPYERRNNELKIVYHFNEAQQNEWAHLSGYLLIERFNIFIYSD